MVGPHQFPPASTRLRPAAHFILFSALQLSWTTSFDLLSSLHFLDVNSTLLPCGVSFASAKTPTHSMPADLPVAHIDAFSATRTCRPILLSAAIYPTEPQAITMTNVWGLLCLGPTRGSRRARADHDDDWPFELADIEDKLLQARTDGGPMRMPVSDKRRRVTWRKIFVHGRQVEQTSARRGAAMRARSCSKDVD